MNGRVSMAMFVAAATSLAIPCGVAQAEYSVAVTSDAEPPAQAALAVIFFDPDSAELTEISQALVAQMAERLNDTEAGKPIKLVGRANEKANPEDDVALSRERAIAVKAVLIAEGVDADRISVHAAGREGTGQLPMKIFDRRVDIQVN